MNEQTESLILEHLRAIRAKQDEHDRKFDMVIERVGSLEKHQARLGEQIALTQTDIANLSLRLDHVDRRLDRIERRLDIVEEPV